MTALDAGRDPRVPATVLTGFLGSGKTTLLNHLLSERHGLKVAVVVNELGAVGIDGKVVNGGEQFVELDNGCLCCALNADLDRVLRDLEKRGGFEHLVLETTGLADPLPIGWIFSRPGLSSSYRLDAIVTVVDAVNIDRALAAAPEAEVQVRRGDIIVLNKLDLVADRGAAALGRVRALNDLAPVLPAEHGRVPWRLILAGCDASGREMAHDVATDDHSHRPSLASWVFASPAGIDESCLEELLGEVPADVYRIKGLVATREGGWLLVNAVAGRIDLTPLAVPPALTQSTLVFIGEALDRPGLEALCRSFFV